MLPTISKTTLLQAALAAVIAMPACMVVAMPQSRPVAPTGSNPGGPLLTGVVTAEHQASLTARMPARITAVLVTENQPVHKGQLLVQLDDSDMRSQLLSARAAVRAAKSQEAKAAAGKDGLLLKADADILTATGTLTEARHKQAQAETGVLAAVAENSADLKAAESGAYKAKQVLDRAEATVKDLETLNKVGGVSRNDLEGARLQLKISRSDYSAALDGVKRVKAGPNGIPFKIAIARSDFDAAIRGVKLAEDGLASARKGRDSIARVADQDVNSAHATTLQALAGVEGALSAVNSMRVLCPINGVAASVLARMGETAQPGMPLVNVVDIANLRIEALALTRQIAGIHRGMRLKATLDSLPGRIIDVAVADIASVAEPDQRSIKVRFKILTPVALRAGISARIYLPTGGSAQP